MELRELQQQALEPLRDRWVHADPPGAGKTPVGLRWLQAHGVGRALVVAPSNVVGHWGRLAPAWYDGLETVVVPKGSKPAQRTLAWEEFRSMPSSQPAAYITSYALFREDEEALVAGSFDAVIFDEAHRLKNRTSLLFKGAKKVAGRTPLVDLSTGSPILGDAEEAWSYLHLLYPKRYRSFWRWAGEHFEIEQTTFHGRIGRPITRITGPKPGALAAIAAEFGPNLVQRPEEVILPHLSVPQRVVYEVEMSSEERRLYDALAKHGWAQEGEEVLITSNVIAKNVRLRQLASDVSSAMSQTEQVGSKVLALAELVDDLAGKALLVFVSFKATAEAVVTRLRKNGVVATTFTGDDDEAAREASIVDFASGRAQVLVGTYGALAEGTDGLQHICHHVALLDHDWSPEIERQAVRRVQRDGQAFQVIVHDFAFKGTIDQDIAEVHAEKVLTADTVLGRSA
jgi:SNF2 family DNA or RNA helicase